MKKGFTLIELIFVIVVLGILASVAIPKLSSSRDDAYQVKGKSDVSSIKAGINRFKMEQIASGNYTSVTMATLDDATPLESDKKLFYRDNNMTYSLLQEPIYSGNSADIKGGDWVKASATQYKFYLNPSEYATFDYNSSTGLFSCTFSTPSNLCSILTR